MTATTTATVTLSDNRDRGRCVDVQLHAPASTTRTSEPAKPVSVTGDFDQRRRDAGNYTFNANTASTTADITARALTVSATGINKMYDGTTTATVTLSDNRVSGDVLTTSYTTAAFVDKNVGTARRST